MILAGDIGGTKTNLGLFETAEGGLALHAKQSYPSREHIGLETIINKFLEGRNMSIDAACFGVAGPIVEGQVVTPNLPWIVSAASLSRTLGLGSVALINDLEATAHGIAALKADEFFTLNEG